MNVYVCMQTGLLKLFELVYHLFIMLILLYFKHFLFLRHTYKYINRSQQKVVNVVKLN